MRYLIVILTSLCITTSLYAEPDIGVKVRPTISKRVKLNPTVYEDISISAHALTLGAAAPDTITFFGGGGIKGLGFNGAATTESVHGSTELLHSYAEGTDIYPHVHWMPTSTDVGQVKWQLEYSWQNDDSIFPSSTTVFGITTTAGTAWTLQQTNFPAMDGTGKKMGGGIAFRLFRDPTDNDDYAADVGLVHLGIHYEKDTLGSASLENK